MLSKIATAIMVFVTGLLPSSCTSAKSKASATHSSAPTSAVSAAPSNKKDLGQLTLTNHYETYIDLGAGKSCTVRPSVIDHHNLALTMAFESKNSAGKTANLNVVQVVVPDGKPLEVAFGGMDYTLTPVVGE